MPTDSPMLTLGLTLGNISGALCYKPRLLRVMHVKYRHLAELIGQQKKTALARSSIGVNGHNSIEVSGVTLVYTS